jgi:hypothetical protein
MKIPPCFIHLSRAGEQDGDAVGHAAGHVDVVGEEQVATADWAADST